MSPAEKVAEHYWKNISHFWKWLVLSEILLRRKLLETSLVTELYFYLITFLQKCKEKVKYTETTGRCNFCEISAQKLQQLRKEERGIIYHIGIFDISNVVSCHGLKRKDNGSFFVFEF